MGHLGHPAAGKMIEYRKPKFGGDRFDEIGRAFISNCQ